MALCDRIQQDISRVFVNPDHFARNHTWNGVTLLCVTDEEEALKRKNNNVADISWDNNSDEVTVFAPMDDFPGQAVPNEHILFDNRPMKILSVGTALGMYVIQLGANEPRGVMG